MTLKEFYAAVGGDYDATLNRIPKESMVLRFVKKYADDKTYAQLTEAVKAQDWETAFRASHDASDGDSPWRHRRNSKPSSGRRSNPIAR